MLSQPKQGNFFMLPNEIFNMDLTAGEIALYAFLIRMEDRKTYTCYPAFKTIGEALKMGSKNTVMKYVRLLEEKELIETKRTIVEHHDGSLRNGNLMFRILPIKQAVEAFHRRQLHNYGSAFKRTDGRWCGVVWYKDEHGERKRKSFSGTTKSEVNKKMKKYIVEFNEDKNDSVESLKTLEESLQNWLQVFKFPAVERTTYDRAESIAKNQIYPQLGKKIVGDITAADIKKLLNYWMTEDYAYTTVKKVYTLLNEYFRYLYQQEIITKNPMANVEMLKKANFMSAQDKENLPPTETITVFSEEEIEKFKAEAFSVFGNGKRKYQQAAAYILMLNTGLRTGEALGLLNSDIDLDNRVMHVQRGVKEVSKREGVTGKSGREVIVGKLKSATSKRDIPLNDTAIEMIKDLRSEYNFGEDAPLIPDEHGEVTRPVNFRKRFYRILTAAGIETKGLHSLRHTFATRLINGTKDNNGNIKSLTPRQVADLLGHTTSEITELYYVKRDTNMLNGITDGFEL